MIETVEISLDQKSAGIKATPAPAPSRGFALWVVLLLLYFMLLPSAAEPGPAGATPQAGSPTVMAPGEPAPGLHRR